MEGGPCWKLVCLIWSLVCAHAVICCSEKRSKLINVFLIFYCTHEGTMVSPTHGPDSPNEGELGFTPAQEEWIQQLVATQGASNSASNSTATTSQHQSTAEPSMSSSSLGELYMFY